MKKWRRGPWKRKDGVWWIRNGEGQVIAHVRALPGMDIEDVQKAVDLIVDSVNRTLEASDD